MNSVVVCGKIIQDPVARKVDLQKGSTVVVSFAIINENGKTKGLFNCESWGPKGKEVMGFKAGSYVCVSGSLIQNSWEKDGEKKSVVKIRANQVVGATFPSEAEPENHTPGYGSQAEASVAEIKAEKPDVFDSVDF